MKCAACGTAMPPGYDACFGCGRSLAASPMPVPVPVREPVPISVPAQPTAPVADGFFGYGGTPRAQPPADTMTGAPLGAVHDPAHPAHRGSGRRPGMIAVIALTVLLLGGGVAYYVIHLGKAAGQTVDAAGALATHGQRSAVEARLQADARNGGTAEETYLSNSLKGYTTSVAALQANGLQVSPGDTVRVVYAEGSAAYCVAASAPGAPTAYYSSSTGSVSNTPCRPL
jgi:hypothetical protein